MHNLFENKFLQLVAAALKQTMNLTGLNISGPFSPSSPFSQKHTSLR
jgi:hypothetical protein